MKYLLPLLALLFINTAHSFGTCNSSYYFSIPTETRARYEALNPTKIIFRQFGGDGVHERITPTVYEDMLVVNLDTCSLAFSASAIDPVNASFWLAQSYELDYDPKSIDCDKEYTFKVYGVWPGDPLSVFFSLHEVVN